MRKIAVGIALMALIGCEGSKVESANSELVNKVSELESRLSTNEAELFELKNQVSDVSVNELIRKYEKIAFLKVGTKEFLPITTEVGVITVSLSNIEQYANGSKVSVEFGNPLSATINNAKFTVDYGSLDKDGLVVTAKEKSKEISLIEPLNAASWNKTELLVEGLPINELGYIRVHSLAVSNIGLYAKRR
ncbi:MAG: DUF3251 domain-containing protein [Methylophilaceae bacterium]